MADEIGYPVIIKAAAGGGEIGMQIVERITICQRLKLCMSGASLHLVMKGSLSEKYIQGAQREFILADESMLFIWRAFLFDTEEASKVG